MPASVTRSRLGAATLAAAGVLFLLYPAVRPWHDESAAGEVAAATASGAWIASHLFAMIGFILVPLGLLAVRQLVATTPAEPLALAGTVTAWVGSGLILPYYGAETYGLHAIAGRLTEGESFDLLALVDAVRFQPVAATTFAIGLLAMAAGAVLVAVAVWRSGVLPRASGVLFAAGFALFLPQFFTPAGVRIAHGALVAVGSIWLAVAMWRAAGTTRRAASG